MASVAFIYSETSAPLKAAARESRRVALRPSLFTRAPIYFSPFLSSTEAPPSITLGVLAPWVIKHANGNPPINHRRAPVNVVTRCLVLPGSR